MDLQTAGPTSRIENERIPPRRGRRPKRLLERPNLRRFEPIGDPNKKSPRPGRRPRPAAGAGPGPEGPLPGDSVGPGLER